MTSGLCAWTSAAAASLDALLSADAVVSQRGLPDWAGHAGPVVRAVPVRVLVIRQILLVLAVPDGAHVRSCATRLILTIRTADGTTFPDM